MELKGFSKNSTVVAVVDSGICNFHEEFSSNLIGGINFVKEGGSELSYEDTHGHGTLCASVIKRMEPSTQIYIVKILDHNAATTSSILLKALQHLLTINVRVINLSIATTNMKYIDQLKEVCDLLKSQGKIIVCSLLNRCTSSIPAVFDSVIGVQSAAFNDHGTYWFNSSYKINCIADGTPILAQGLEGKWEMFGGNSKAAAVFSGLILHKLSQNPCLTNNQLVKQLVDSAVTSKWEKDSNVNYMDFKELDKVTSYIEYPYHAVKKMVSILADILEISEQQKILLYQYKLIRPEFRLDPKKCILILKGIEEQFAIKLNYEKVSYNEFQSIYSLLDLIYGDDGE